MSDHDEFNKFMEASVHRAEKVQGVLSLMENALRDVRDDIDQKVCTCNIFEDFELSSLRFLSWE